MIGDSKSERQGIVNTLGLAAGAERRILQGHRWVFSNEVTDRLSDFEPGGWVNVVSSKNVPLGSGYVNPHCLIAARLVASPNRKPDRDLFRERLMSALARRQHWYPSSDVYRLVYGESDGLPGLVVDRYGDVLSYQITTLGMSVHEAVICEILQELLHPEAIVRRNDTRARLLEDLPLEKGFVVGSLSEPVTVRIEGLQFVVDPLDGQKTGLYLDQRDNRLALAKWLRGRKVLDLFCYDGSWSVMAATGGAREVTGVDQSAQAVEMAERNARLNDVTSNCRFLQDDVFHFLKGSKKNDFDAVVVDPPAFVKKKSALREAMKGYTDLNRRAMLTLKKGGSLITCSCSYHLNEDSFRLVLLQAAKACGKRLRLLEARGQAVDHPILLAMPETRYLKCYVLEVF